CYRGNQNSDRLLLRRVRNEQWSDRPACAQIRDECLPRYAIRVPAERCRRCQRLLLELSVTRGHTAAIQEPAAPEPVWGLAIGPGNPAEISRQRQNLLELQLGRNEADAGSCRAGQWRRVFSRGIPEWRFLRTATAPHREWPARARAHYHLRSAHRGAVPGRCGQQYQYHSSEHDQQECTKYHQPIRPSAAIYADRYSGRQHDQNRAEHIEPKPVF